MILYNELINNDGSPSGTIVQTIQLQINERQRYYVVGFNDGTVPELGGGEGYSSTFLGPLSEMNPILEAQLCNSLNIYGWSWDACDNPLVVLIEASDEKVAEDVSWREFRARQRSEAFPEDGIDEWPDDDDVDEADDEFDEGTHLMHRRAREEGEDDCDATIY